MPRPKKLSDEELKARKQKRSEQQRINERDQLNCRCEGMSDELWKKYGWKPNDKDGPLVGLFFYA